MKRGLMISLLVLSAVAGIACSDETKNTAATVTAGSTGGSGDGGSGATGGSSSVGGSGGDGGSPWDLIDGPGMPGAITTVTDHLPVVSMSSRSLSGRSSERKQMSQKDNSGESWNISDGIMGAAGAGGAGGAGGDDGCTNYLKQDPDLTAALAIELAFSHPPMYYPASESACGQNLDQLVPPAVYTTDAGVMRQFSVFTEADDSSIFGLGILPVNTELPFATGNVGLITGLVSRNAICGDNLYVATNASTTIVQINMTTNARTDFNVNTIGVTGLACWESDTKLIFGTPRTFTANSWEQQDPTLFVELTPAALKVFDPSTGEVTHFVNIPVTDDGGVQVVSRFIAQASTPSPDGGYYHAGIGSTFVVDPVTGNLLYGDLPAGSLWEITPAAEATMIFTSDRLFTGVDRDPNGVVRVVLSAVADGNATTILESPMIGVYNAVTGVVDDWQDLSTQQYDEVLTALYPSGVVFHEKGFAPQKTFLLTDSNDITHDPNDPAIYLSLGLQEKVVKIVVE